MIIILTDIFQEVHFACEFMQAENRPYCIYSEELYQLFRRKQLLCESQHSKHVIFKTLRN